MIRKFHDLWPGTTFAPAEMGAYMSKDGGIWRKRSDETENRKKDQQTGQEIPGDTDAPDIVGRTGEEMPEVAHDEVGRMEPDELFDFEENVVQRGISATDPTSMPRDDDHPGGVKNSPEFHDRPAPIRTPTETESED